MYCRGCNTRLEDGAASCPNCGRTVKKSALGARPSVGTLDANDLTPLPRPAPSAEPLPLEREASRSGPVRAKPGATPRREESSDAGLARLDPARLRELVAASPDLLEPGLRVYADEKGKPVGAGYASGVGEIDLLGLDAGGGLVAALVAEPAEKGSDLVAAILSRVGWVKKHLARPGQEVRGVVLVESRPDDLGYAAAAVSDTVAFKTWRVSILIEDLDL